MTPPKVPYLCGGILFTLILQARKVRTKVRDKFNSGSDGLNETDIMMGLIEAVTGNSLDSCQGKTFGKVTSQFKTCQSYGTTYITFTEPSFISSFNSSIKKKDPDLLERMSEFVGKYINEMRSEWLVKALFEVIEQDEAINPDTTFSVTQSTAVKKNELVNITMVELPVFLLSVLSFIINERTDNTKGRSTFEAWHTQSNAKSPWKYNSNIGNSITRNITVKLSCKVPKLDVIGMVSTETQNSVIPGFTGLSDGHSFEEYSYSSEDIALLKEFTADYDEIMFTLIGENYADSLIDMTLPNKIKNLYSTKWGSKADAFLDPTLKSYVFGLLGELNTLSNSFFSNTTQMPSIRSTRAKIRNLYVKLHPDLFAGAFPYEAFIDDWDDGEF